MRRLAPVAIIALAVVATVLAFRAYYGDRSRPSSVDARDCYYDGRPRTDCPTPRTGPHADTAWIHAGAIDTLYVRLPGAVGPAALVALYAATVAPPLATDGERTRVGAALTAAAPALPPATASALVARLHAAGSSRDSLAPLFTVGERQKLYDSSTAARVVAGGATSKDEALPSRGLLTLSRPAIDDARQWALVYAERAVAPARTDEAPTIERSYVLLHVLPDGRWRAVRVVGAREAGGGDTGLPASASLPEA